MVSELQDKLRQMRRAFHQNPELGFEEVETKAVIASHLRALGIEVFDEGCGVIGRLSVGGGNRAIGLRADMDALPILETSGHDYVSHNKGKMHACGHDGHMSMLLGAAELLASDPHFDGTVIFVFQPNEEHGLGAQAMLEEGLLTKFPMDEIYAIHNLPNAPLGEVSTRVGQICSSESLFEIEIVGQGGHASMPQVGVDAITVGAEMVGALQTIVSRKMAPLSGVVVSVTEFNSDGMRNVLAGRAVIKGDVRCRLPEQRGQVEAFMRQIAQGIGAAHNVSVTVDFKTEFIEVINAKEPVDAVIKAARAEGLPAIGDRPAMSFSEDFAHFTNQVPGCFLLMGNGQDGAHAKPLHASDYDFNDELLMTGAQFLAKLACQQLPKSETK